MFQTKIDTSDSVIPRSTAELSLLRAVYAAFLILPHVTSTQPLQESSCQRYEEQKSKSQANVFLKTYFNIHVSSVG